MQHSREIDLSQHCDFAIADPWYLRSVPLHGPLSTPSNSGRPTLSAGSFTTCSHTVA